MLEAKIFPERKLQDLVEEINELVYSEIVCSSLCARRIRSIE